MKKFNNVTEYEILNGAWNYFLQLWDRERAGAEKAQKEGRPAQIWESRRDKYWAKLQEIQEALVELENK